MAKIAEPRDYWIAPNAIYITRNALGDPDRIQGNVAAGAAILCYMKGVEGLEYDNGHNYKSWPLSLSPTYFNTSTEKYVYAAIPKNTQIGTQAIIVFPSQKLDVNGQTEQGDQIGSTDYYYIWLQGILSASVNNDGATQEREWEQYIQTGLLSSDEALATLDTDWYSYSQLTQTVSFLRDIAMSVKSSFLNLFVGTGEGKGNLTGVATNDNKSIIPDDSSEHIVTPSFLGGKYLKKDVDDTVNGFITFVKGLRSKLLAQLEGGAQFGENGSYAITSTGDATLDDIIASTINLSGNATIGGLLSVARAIITTLTSSEITTERLTVTKAAHFFSLIIDELRSVGGSIILTAANATVDIKETTQAGDYRLLWRATDGEKRIRNQFISGDGVICMTFNESDVSGYNISNKYYWMRCIDSGVTNRTENDEEVLYNYIVLSSSEKDPDGTSIPEVGDKIVQLGYNGLASDSTQRQSAIILAAYNSPDAGLNAPMFAHYSGIDDFNLTSHRKTYIALQGSEFVGTFRVLAQDGTYINIVDRLNSIVSDIDTIKNQTDGLMVIYFGYGEPKLNNEPASTWNTSEYASHVGDVYYDKTKNPGDTGGRAWQWDIKNNVYQWIEITDSYTIEALERAAAAQAAAAVKIRCFATTPYPPYDVNDLWIADNGEVKVCINAKAQGELFNESDWVLKVGSEDYRSFYERLYNVNPSAFDNNSRGYIDILKGTAHPISEGNFYYNVDSNNNITKLYQAQSSQFVEITDEAAIEAVQMALSSYDLRTEYMRRIFLDTPVVPYTAGNIYVKKFNVYNPLSRETLAMGRDIYVCTKTRTNSESYQATDWLRVSISSAAEFNVLSNQIRGLVYDQNNTSLLLLTSKAINILNTFFTSDADGKNATVKSGGLVVQEGISSLIAEEVRNQVGDDIATKAELTVAANEIKANIASQKYNSNLFGFTDGLSFTGSCVPFIQAYGVEIVGNSVGTITGFGGKSVDGVTISFDARTLSGTTSLSIGVNGTVVGTVSDVSATWQRKTITVDDITTLNSISVSYSTSDIATVALRNIKVESGTIATSFCISDNDGKELVSTNMYSTTVNYNKDPIFMKNDANETIDTSDAAGHGNVLTFYRNNMAGSDGTSPFMLYNDYIGWSDDPRTKLFTAGKVYTISFWAKAAVSGLKIHTGLWGHVTTARESSTVSYTTHNSGARYSDKLTDGVYDNGGCECLHHLTTSWKRYYARFYIQTGVTAVPIIQCNNGWALGSDDSVYLYIADVRLEEGYIADESDPMSISGARTRSESRMTLTAQEFSVAVRNEYKEAGLKVTIDGVQFTGNKVGFASSNGIDYIRLGQDSDGIPYFIFYDPQGTPRYNLGYKGLVDLIGQTHHAEFKLRLEYLQHVSTENPDVDAAILWDDAVDSTSETNKVYRFSAQYTIDSNGDKLYSPSEGADVDGLHYETNVISGYLPTGTKVAANDTWFIFSVGSLDYNMTSRLAHTTGVVKGKTLRIVNGKVTNEYDYFVEKVSTQDEYGDNVDIYYLYFSYSKYYERWTFDMLSRL